MPNNHRKERVQGLLDTRHSVQWMLLCTLSIVLAVPGLLQVSTSAGRRSFSQINLSADRAIHSSQPNLAISLEWFRSGLSLAALLLGVQILRSTRRKARLAIIRDERERLARDLHDTVIQGCTGVSILLEAIASTSEDKQNMQRELLDFAREQARRTVDDARSAVWDLRQASADQNLVEALKEVGAQISRESGSHIDVRHNVHSLRMPARSIEEISMTVREAISNAARHSGSEKIVVDLRSEKKSLRISVQDYGCGISEAAKPEDSRHYGILGMHERMKRLGGGLQIDCMPGEGTTVQLILQWASMRGRLLGRA